MTHKTLMRSSLVAALAASAPATVTSAVTTVYDNDASFKAVAGAAATWTEDYESFDPTPIGYQLIGPLAAGLGDGSVTNSTTGFSLATIAPGYYPTTPTTAMGVFADNTLTMSFADGVSAVGMDVTSNYSFIGSPFDAIQYTIYDMGGVPITSGALAADGNTIAFFGVTSDVAIGSIDLTGTVFDVLGASLWTDNVRGYEVPAPGAGMILGIAGLAACRRRR